MHLTKNQQLFGYPALEIRRLMLAGAEPSVDTTSGHLDSQEFSWMKQQRWWKKLLEEGFIAVRIEDLRYELTTKGRALAMASAKPIRRSTAERLVSDFLQRVEEVNNDANLLYWIDEVVVFGSFLTESEVLGDVDLGLLYTPRIEGETDWRARCDARVEQARANGRNFRLYMDEFLWPMHEILLRLRKRSGSLSLHDLESHRTFIEALPHRHIYLRRNGTPY